MSASRAVLVLVFNYENVSALETAASLIEDSLALTAPKPTVDSLFPGYRLYGIVNKT